MDGTQVLPFFNYFLCFFHSVKTTVGSVAYRGCIGLLQTFIFPVILNAATFI